MGTRYLSSKVYDSSFKSKVIAVELLVLRTPNYVLLFNLSFNFGHLDVHALSVFVFAMFARESQQL